MIELYPHFNHKPALMRAYKAADKSGDGFIGRREFRLLLHYLGYFNELWEKFEAIDTSHDRRITPEEFANGCGVIGLPLSAEEADEEFVQLDANGGGFILFDEFCSWAARRHIGEDDDDDAHAEDGIDGHASGQHTTPNTHHARSHGSSGKAARPSPGKHAHSSSGKKHAPSKSPTRTPVKRLEVPSKAERTKVFKRMDNNGNGLLSLARPSPQPRLAVRLLHS